MQKSLAEFVRTLGTKCCISGTFQRVGSRGDQLRKFYGWCASFPSTAFNNNSTNHHGLNSTGDGGVIS